MHTSFSTQQVSITVSDSGAIADSTEISFGEYQSGTVYVPAGSGLTSLTWHAAPVLGGTYLAAYNASGAIDQTVQAGRCYPIPTDLKGSVGLKIAGNTDGSVDVSLKG